MTLPQAPTFVEEERLFSQGYSLIAGVDEAGRGALAGPVAAAAVVLPYPLNFPWVSAVRDSKLLRASQREVLAREIRKEALAYSVEMASSQIIDSQGIVAATRLAMRLAVDKLPHRPQFLLIDYLRLPEIALPQKGIVKGDRLCFSIACASILAKVARDGIMEEMEKEYPGYNFARHKGYGTAQHLSCLSQLGACPQHRRSFAPVREALLEE